MSYRLSTHFTRSFWQVLFCSWRLFSSFSVFLSDSCIKYTHYDPIYGRGTKQGTGSGTGGLWLVLSLSAQLVSWYFFSSLCTVWDVHIVHQVRSGYRVAELSYGYQGFLATTEAYFYLLDTLPLVIANLVYIPCWPGRFIRDKPIQEDVQLKSSHYSSTV